MLNHKVPMRLQPSLDAATDRETLFVHQTPINFHFKVVLYHNFPKWLRFPATGSAPGTGS